MKKLLPILGLFLISCEKPKTEVKYDFTYTIVGPNGWLEYYTQTKYTIVNTKDLPDTDSEWIAFIDQLEYFHDMEDGINDGFYYGTIFFVDNFWW